MSRNEPKGYAVRLAERALRTLPPGTLDGLAQAQRSALARAVTVAVDVAYSQGFEDGVADSAPTLREVTR